LYTGGIPASASSDDIAGADIIIATPEKWDAMTRRWRDNIGLIGQIALLCIDEVSD
jgi:ATP-dependent DNA helicase HFM1/MER3